MAPEELVKFDVVYVASALMDYLAQSPNLIYELADGATNIECIDEVLEWYIVSPRLGYLLMEYSEVVLKKVFDFEYIWGRRCTGQPVYQDAVIRMIAESL